MGASPPPPPPTRCPAARVPAGAGSGALVALRAAVLAAVAGNVALWRLRGADDGG